GNLPGDTRSFETLRIHLARHTVQPLKRGFQVGDYAHVHRVVPADFRRIDVDVDETGRRDVEGVVSVPGAAVGFLEARAEREYPVCFETGVVDELRAPESRHAEDQGVIVRNRALAHQ